MGNPTASRRGERGFTLIEVMIAATVLVVGMLSTFRLIDGANTTTSLNSARTGAIGLAREIVEYARATDYDKLTPALLEGALRQRPSLAGASGDPWVVRRRGVDYTITPTVCTFDDPKDGLASSPPLNACPAAASVNSLVDANPDDFRRVTLKLDWRVRAHNGTMTQSALVVNPAGALGPRITNIWDPSQSLGDEVTTANQITWGDVPTHPLTTTTAAGVHWSADDRISRGDATGGPTNWGFTWDLGTPKLTPLTVDNTWVPDGSYDVQVQAVDGRGVPGEARTVTVNINRHKPAPVLGAAGGYNARFGGVADMHWDRYPERDVVGYRVYRDDSTGTDSSKLVCSTTDPDKTDCTDANPGAAGSTHHYYIFALDCNSLFGACTSRQGVAFDLPITLSAGLPPLAPVGLTATVSDGLPQLTWTPVPGAIFYRIYRDTGTGLADRYDETIDNQATYTDPHPGDHTNHTYWVTAVDSNFNESAASLSITAPGS